MVGGASYLGARAGQRAAQNEADQQAMEYDQSARIAQLEQQQQMQQMPAAAPAPQSDLAAKLTELKGLHDQGVLTDEEFAAAKQKLINES
jgi:hypothetical protein